LQDYVAKFRGIRVLRYLCDGIAGYFLIPRILISNRCRPWAE